MTKVMISGGRKLCGTVRVDGAKNSALKLICASLLTDDPMDLRNMPVSISDVKILSGMMQALGKKIEHSGSSGMRITGGVGTSELVWSERSIRNTLLVLGCLLARTGFGSVPLPGGCKLGERKYDIHVALMEQFGAKVWEENENLCAKLPTTLVGQEIRLPMRSTGATEHSILMGVLAKGSTRIWNPHIRPEIMDLIALLNEMGAEVEVFGQESIAIEGVSELRGVQHRCIPDNMEALTWMIATAVTGGEVRIESFPLAHLEVPLIHLRESGLNYFVSANSNHVVVKDSTPYPFEIATGPYPGINSDMQPIMAVYGAMARGESRIVDLRFPGRYQYARELEKFGMNYEIDGDMMCIHGGKSLHPSAVRALDLRAGAALALCALAIHGQSEIHSFDQVERGYSNFVSKLKMLGAHVERVD